MNGCNAPAVAVVANQVQAVRMSEAVGGHWHRRDGSSFVVCEGDAASCTPPPVSQLEVHVKPSSAPSRGPVRVGKPSGTALRTLRAKHIA